MKDPGIISLLMPKNAGVLESFVRRNPGTRVFFVEGWMDEAALARVVVAGGEASPLHGLLSLYDRACAKMERVSRLSHLEAVLESEQWARFSSDRGWSPARFGPIVAERARNDLMGISTTIAGLERARSMSDLRLVIVNEDWTPVCRAVVLWAKEHGIPSLHLAHSLDLTELFTVHGRVMSDTLALFGERAAEEHEDAAADVSARQIRVTGNPAWDIYPGLVTQREAVRAELAAGLDCPPSVPWVVFATTWIVDHTAFADEDVFEKTLRVFLQACKTLIDAGSEMRIIIKDRPPNKDLGETCVAELSAELGIDQERIYYTLVDIERWVVAADVVVSVCSNVSIEALLTRTPAINLVTEMDAALGIPFDAFSGIVEAEDHELAAAIERILGDADYREGLREQMREAAVRYNRGVDGAATARVVELIEELALPARGRTFPGLGVWLRITAGWSALAGLGGLVARRLGFARKAVRRSAHGLARPDPRSA